ncbi:uncharacterized protein isoform X3 [Choristoneura fumiferana]|uniref:uncharacterized protein isoform X2 n=1 Tax=Choristoneura fumiferana TaxID=7141 RepID=UPI003D155E53
MKDIPSQKSLNRWESRAGLFIYGATVSKKKDCSETTSLLGGQEKRALKPTAIWWNG